MILPQYFAVARRRDLVTLTGRDRQSFLQGMVSNDVAGLTPGTGCYAFHLTSTGQIVADMRILCTESSLILDTEPGWGEPLAAALEHYLVMERAKITLSADVETHFVGGVDAPRQLAVSLDTEGDNTLLADGTLVAATTLIAAPGFTIYSGEFPHAAEILTPETLDGLRIEAGIPLGQRDFDNKTLAPETGQISRAIHYRKGCYVGQEIVARIDARGHTNRSLVGFLTETVAQSNESVSVDGAVVGRITTAALGPTLGVPVALGYIRNEHATPGTRVTLGNQTATIATLPFVESVR